MKTSTTVSNYYDSIADQYDGLYEDALSISENAIIGSLIASLLKGGDSIRVLDLGCGTGLGFEILKAAGIDVLSYEGMDISSGMIKKANTLFEDSDFVNFSVGDMASYLCGVEDGKYDLVMSLFGSPSHSKDIEAILRETNRVLKKNGQAVFMFYSRWSLKNMYYALKNYDLSLMGKEQPYNVRNCSIESSCTAYFYGRKELVEKMNTAGYNSVQATSMNGLFELPGLATKNWTKS